MHVSSVHLHGFKIEVSLFFKFFIEPTFVTMKDCTLFVSLALINVVHLGLHIDLVE